MLGFDSYISIHAPRGGSDQLRLIYANANTNFNPRSPWGERLGNLMRQISNMRFQSTLPVGGATCWRQATLSASMISIHAPRGGSDPTHTSIDRTLNYFNPRSPWGERRPSASPGWSRGNFNPRSPWGERLKCKRCGAELIVFQSTLPVGGATPLTRVSAGRQIISIHAPRGGSDSKDAQIFL